MDVQPTNPKSLRTVYSSLLNPCHKEFRQFRQKRVQFGTSKAYLIMWPVSVYKMLTGQEIQIPLINDALFSGYSFKAFVPRLQTLSAPLCL